MLKAITIKEFRCFRELRLDGFERINLISGANNVGKTALLEALFLHFGGFNAGLPRLIEDIRGLGSQPLVPEDLWGWLFPGRDLSREIRTEGTDEAGQGHTLTVRLSDVGGALPSSGSYSDISHGPGSAAFATGGVSRGIRLDCRFSDGQSVQSRADVTESGVRIENAPRDRFLTAIFLPSLYRLSSHDNAAMFTRLEQSGRTEWLTAALRRIDPRLKRIAILVAGGAPMIHADLGEGALVPISHLGQGFGRLLSALLAISLARDGMVLIDEIENGVYHEAMDQVWGAIREASVHANAQVFATTHSWECIRSAHLVFPVDPGCNLRLYRIERVDGTIEAVSYDADSLSMALKTELEVR